MILLKKRTAHGRGSPSSFLGYLSEERARSLWRRAVQHSYAYASVLRMGSYDIEKLCVSDRIVIVHTLVGEARITPRLVRGEYYGYDPEHLLLAYVTGKRVIGIGDGSTACGTVNDNDHGCVLSTIRTGSFRIEREHYWP